jgi:malate permease and related proteins
MMAVNGIAVNVLAPLLVFSALAAKDFDIVHNSSLIAAGVLISLGSGLLAWPLARLLGYDPRTFVPPMMYNNCGNMGLPLAVFAFGATGLPAAVALFIASNLVFFSIGLRIVSSGRRDHIGGKAPHPFGILLNPMMLASLLGIVFALLHWSVPAPLMAALTMLGDAAIPLMLFALGVRMLDANLKSWRIGVAGAVICPVTGLAVAWLLEQMLQLTPVQLGQMYLFAALPPAVFSFVVAEQYRQEPDKVAAIVLIGNLAALIFVPVGLWMGLR